MLDQAVYNSLCTNILEKGINQSIFHLNIGKADFGLFTLIKKLNGNYIRMLHKNCFKQIMKASPQKQQLYDHWPHISQTTQVR